MMRVARLLMIFAAAVCAASTVVAEETLDEATAIAKIQELGGTIHDGRPMGLSINLEPIPFLVIPFWAIVIPLTLLSAYLLLSKSRSTTQTSKPMELV